MRRLAAITAVVVAAATLTAVLLSASAQGSSTANFDVIFDDARGLVAGQLVKVAGAQAGSIQNVTVTKQGSGASTTYKARIEATIDSKFMPFRANATCTIRPQGLIAENYVECDPGRPPAPVLSSVGGQPPTVPVHNTTEPVSLLDLFNIFNVPTRERFTLLVNELGIGTAARGQDFNEILYRANPALKLAHQVIGILARQKTELAALVDATNTVAKQAASHTGAVQSFLQQASTLASTTAQHRSNLALAIQRLPGLLAAAQPALQQLDVVARDGTPLVQQLGVAAPYLNQVSIDLGPFVSAAKPGLAALSSALTVAIPAIKHATPLTKALHHYTSASLEKTKLSGRLYTSLQQAGFGENFLGIVYYVAASLARFDSISHLLGFAVENIQNGACIPYATTPVPGCGANYGSAPASAVSRSARSGTRAGQSSSVGSGARANVPGAGTPSNGPRKASQTQSRTSASQPQPGPHPQQPTTGAGNVLQNLANFLLR
jgi:phospholipid/cholesterol/gamma-HCH transport system substrate-binding protein